MLRDVEGAMGEESGRTHDVFLSYSSKDKTWADSACAVLEHHRIRCWIAPRDMTPGDEWGAGVIKGLNASRIMVLIFSDHANASKQVRKEVERAISKELPVLAFRIQNVEPKDAMEFNLSNIHWLDAFTPPVERQMELLAAWVQKLLGRDAEPKHPGTGAGPEVNIETSGPGAFWLMAIAASLFGLVALGAIVITMQNRNAETKTTASDNPPERVVHDDKGHASAAADSSGAKPPIIPPPRLDRVRPEGPARLIARARAGTWAVEGDQFIQEDPRGGSLLFGDEGWSESNYDLTIEMSKIAGPGGLRVDFRTGGGKSYWLGVGDRKNEHYLNRNSNPSGIKGGGSAHQIRSSPGTIRPLEWYKLRISLRGPRIRIDLDDHVLFDCMDNFSEKGGVAFRCIDSSARFRNFRVTAPDGTVLWEGPPNVRKE